MMPRSALHVVVRGLQQLEDDVLDVFADVSRLGQRRRVGDRERHIETLRQRLREVGLPGSGRPEHEDVALGDLDFFGLLIGSLELTLCAHPLVVVVHGDRQCALRLVLTDDVFVEELEDLARLRQIDLGDFAVSGRFGHALLDDLVAQLDALVADVHTGASDQLLDLFLALPAEGALEQVGALADSGHGITSPGSRRCVVSGYRLAPTFERSGAPRPEQPDGARDRAERQLAWVRFRDVSTWSTRP